MKKMRLPIIIFLGVAIIGVILGSFLDLKISEAIASPNNKFAIALSAIGENVGFWAIAFIGGGFIACAVKGNYNKFFKIAFWIIAIGLYAGALYYAHKSFFGKNGFRGVAPDWVGYLISFLPLLLVEGFGYYVFKDNQNDKLWIILLIMLAVMAAILLGLVNGIKGIMHRPRFRTVSTTEVEFHNWWQRCTNYKDYMSSLGILEEEFKSFPSGHTSEAAMLLFPVVFLPLANKKFEKNQLATFSIFALIVLIVALARIFAAAHYLSDVSMGAALMGLGLLILNEVMIRLKFLHLKEEDVIFNK